MNAKNNMNMGGGGEGLARQQSVYSLTLDEFQNSIGGLGKDFGSMNMDELLKSIWTAEESQAIASAAGAPVQTTAATAGQMDGSGGPQRQGSLTLPRTLSQKTVDEVWRDLMYGGGAAGAVNSQMQLGQKRQPTLGEMTLEEFLVRAGVVREGPLRAGGVDINNAATAAAGNSLLFHGQVPAPSVASGVMHSGFDLKYSQPGGSAAGLLPNPVENNSAATLPITSSGARPYASGIATVGLSNPLGAADGGIMGFGDPAVAVGLGSGFAPGVVGLGGVSPDLSSDGLEKGNGDVAMVSPPVPYVFGSGLRGRKGTAVEKVVERRQRRMIKNRESAARSRARKQAYTMELEAEVAKLKEQNKELQKKQEEIMEKQKNQALELFNQQKKPRKICLRRTRTGPW